MESNPQKQIAAHFGVSDLRHLPQVEEFKHITKAALGYFVNQEGDYPYLWIINKSGMNGYALAGGKLNLWKSRMIHKIN